MGCPFRQPAFDYAWLEMFTASLEHEDSVTSIIQTSWEQPKTFDKWTVQIIEIAY